MDQDRTVPRAATKAIRSVPKLFARATCVKVEACPLR